MINERNRRKNCYKAFGLRIVSEMPLPELPFICLQDGSVDIEVKIEDLSDVWSDYSIPNERFVVRSHFVMFQISGAAIYCVRNGKSISVSPMEGSNVDKIRLYLLGTCMGIALIQRQILPLHGSAIAIDGKAIAIVGDSGAGKSTLAAEFLARGYKLLSDDLIPVAFSENQSPMVLPAYPQQKLWEESLLGLGIENDNFQPLFERSTKFAIPVSSHFIEDALPLVGIFELIKSDEEEIELHPVYKLDRMQTLFYHTYRNFLFSRLGLMEWHFNHSLKIANQVDVFQLRRPNAKFTASELASLILNELNMEGKENDQKPSFIFK